MAQTDGRVEQWLRDVWPDAAVLRTNTSTGRDSDAWDVYRPGDKPFGVEVSGPLRAHLPSLNQRLSEAEELKSKIESNAPGTVILHTDGIDFREPKK